MLVSNTEHLKIPNISYRASNPSILQLLQILSIFVNCFAICQTLPTTVHQVVTIHSNKNKMKLAKRNSSLSESTSEVDSNLYLLFEEQIDHLTSKVSDYESKLIKEHKLVASLESKLNNEKSLSASWEEKCKKNHALIEFNLKLVDSRDHVNTLTLAKKD